MSETIEKQGKDSKLANEVKRVDLNQRGKSLTFLLVFIKKANIKLGYYLIPESQDTNSLNFRGNSLNALA